MYQPTFDAAITGIMKGMMRRFGGASSAPSRNEKGDHSPARDQDSEKIIGHEKRRMLSNRAAIMRKLALEEVPECGSD